MVDRVELSTTLDTGPVKPGSEVAPKAEDRPTWLPDQFKSAEDLAKSYAELQAELTRSKQELAGLKKPEETTPPATTEKPKDEQVADQLKAQGIDVDGASKRFWETKTISDADATMLSEGLVKAGLAADANVAKGILQQFAEGQLARVENHRASIAQKMGGEQGMKSLVAWGNTNPEGAALINEYNKVLDSGNFAGASAAFDKVQAAYTAANGREPSTRISGGTGPEVIGGVYQSQAEMIRDMQNPLYKTDEAFRAKVVAKLSRSRI
jgi:hypothetical protein